MAHLIEINNGVASFVENGRKERAWHRLGQVFDGQLSVKEALELSHADYQVEARNVFAMTPALQDLLDSDVAMIQREELKFNNLMTGTAAMKVQKAYDLLAAV